MTQEYLFKNQLYEYYLNLAAIGSTNFNISNKNEFNNEYLHQNVQTNYLDQMKYMNSSIQFYHFSLFNTYQPFSSINNNY